MTALGPLTLWAETDDYYSHAAELRFAHDVQHPREITVVGMASEYRQNFIDASPGMKFAPGRLLAGLLITLSAMYVEQRRIPDALDALNEAFDQLWGVMDALGGDVATPNDAVWLVAAQYNASLALSILGDTAQSKTQLSNAREMLEAIDVSNAHLRQPSYRCAAMAISRL